MGSCASRAGACVGGRHGKHRPSSGASGAPAGAASGRRRKRRLRRRVSVGVSRGGPSVSMETIDEAGGERRLSHSNTAFQASSGRAEETWFDSVAWSATGSDGEDDFHSIQDDISLNDFENDVASGSGNINTEHTISAEVNHRIHKSGEQKRGSFDNGVRSFVSHDDVASVSTAEGTHGGSRLIDNCGLLSNNCLPCLAASACLAEKKKAFMSSPPNSMRIPSLKLSFKKKSGEAAPVPATLFSPKAALERPLAGSQVQLSLLGKKVLDSWSKIDPCTFRVRGANFIRDKKKEYAPNFAAYYPFGVDVYRSQRKINHICRYVQIPTLAASSKLPPMLVVNVQVPVYPAALFQTEYDGEGVSFVLYFRLSDGYLKELPPYFIEHIRKIIDDEVEKVRVFPMETIVPFRERLKILGRVVNAEDLNLNAAERKLMSAYNEKPVLSRPQHEFFLGENYLEIDLDMHRFSYISRKGFETFLDRLKLCILDIGLTIQGNKPEELPEQILCCVRLNGIDYTKYHPLVHSS